MGGGNGQRIWKMPLHVSDRAVFFLKEEVASASCSMPTWRPRPEALGGGHAFCPCASIPREGEGDLYHEAPWKLRMLFCYHKGRVFEKDEEKDKQNMEGSD